MAEVSKKEVGAGIGDGAYFEQGTFLNLGSQWVQLVGWLHTNNLAVVRKH